MDHDVVAFSYFYHAVGDTTATGAEGVAGGPQLYYDRIRKTAANEKHTRMPV